MPSYALRTVCAFGLALTACLVADPITLPLDKVKDPCSPYEFTCKSGQCVSQYNVCDAFEDCFDGDDENKTMCLAKPCLPDYPYKCTNNGICIPYSWLCDGHNDCGDNSDEVIMTCVQLLHKEHTVKVDERHPNALEPNIDGNYNKENGDDKNKDDGGGGDDDKNDGEKSHGEKRHGKKSHGKKSHGKNDDGKNDDEKNDDDDDDDEDEGPFGEGGGDGGDDDDEKDDGGSPPGDFE